MNYRAVIIGCGRIGCGFMLDPLRSPTSTHAGAYMEADGVDLIALCDCQEGLAQRYVGQLEVPRAYTDYHEMLVREQPDIVSVCTPPETHAQIVCNVAYSGAKAIFCEKPMATSSHAAGRMVRVCSQQGALLMINHQRRLSPFHQEIAHSIQHGEIGSIQQVTCYYGGGVANTGSHLFDLLRLYFGEVKAVAAHFSPNTSHKAEDPNIDAEIEFERAPSVVVQACDCNNYAIFEINILGTQGRLRVLSSGYRAELEMAQPSPNFAGIKELAAVKPLPFLCPEPNKWILLGVGHILDCLESDSVSPLSSGEDGLRALHIIEVLKHSANLGIREEEF